MSNDELDHEEKDLNRNAFEAKIEDVKVVRVSQVGRRELGEAESDEGDEKKRKQFMEKESLKKLKVI